MSYTGPKTEVTELPSDQREEGKKASDVIRLFQVMDVQEKKTFLGS